MKHGLSIKVSNNENFDSVVRVKKFAVREKLLNMLFGSKQQVMVIVPGKQVNALSIVDDVGGDS